MRRRHRAPKKPPAAGDAAAGDRPPTVKEAHAQSRAEKVEAMRAAEARQQRTRKVAGIGAGVAALVAVVGALVAVAIAQDDGDTAAGGELAGVESFTPARGHVTTGVDYPQNPPAGGEHNPAWLNCGVYPEPVPNENAVHLLEHGALWVTYRPDLPAADVQALQESLPDTYIVLSPYPDLPAPVVASAWGKQLALDGTEDPRLEEFVRAYRQGPQTPEPGAACTGGIDASSALADAATMP